MKKTLLIVLDVLLLIILCLFMFKGVQLGKSRVLSFKGIANANAELTQEIAKANEENEKYNSQLEKIKADIIRLTKAKKEYLDLMTVSTDSEIQAALQTKTYTIEYLWSQVGNYATKEGVVTKMELSSSSLGDNEYRNLNFTISGNYLAITNFISDLENDSNLEFTIDNFDMVGTGNSQETCTFVVRDVRIKKEETTVVSNDSSKKDKDKEQSTEADGNLDSPEANTDSSANENNNNNNQADKNQQRSIEGQANQNAESNNIVNP